MAKPNIVFICTDQQRSDSLGCAGNPIARTPNIDSIAEAGTRFTRHQTPMQICSPSRATMMTGLYPRNHSLIVNGMALPQSVPTLMARLSDAGYRTHGVGKQHLQPLLAPRNRKMPDSRSFWETREASSWCGPFYGYQTVDLLLGESDTAQLAGHYANWLKEYHPQAVNLLAPEQADRPPPDDLDEIWQSAMPAELHYNTWITKQSTRFLQTETVPNQPFFLYVSYPDPHHPFDPPAPYAGRFNPADMPLPQVAPHEFAKMLPYYSKLYPKGQGFRKLYWAALEDMEAGSMITTEGISDDSMRRAIAYTYAMIEMIDDGIGEILRQLAQLGLTNDTIVVFTSDHGELLGDHGLLHKGPPPYRQLTEVALLMQGPGIQSGMVVDGLSNHVDLAPTLLEMAGVETSDVQFDGQSMRPLLSGECSDIRQYNFGEYHPTVKPELYNQTVSTRKWRYTIYQEKPEWQELFDLENDPHEKNNVINVVENKGIKEALFNVLANEFPPQANVDNEWLCKW